METFVATKSYTYKILFREMSYQLALMAILLLICFLWFPEKISAITLILLGVLFLIDYYKKASRMRIKELKFDDNNREIVIACGSLFSKINLIKIPFDRAVIEVGRTKYLKRIFEPLTLCLLLEKTEIIELNRKKDGFQTATMEKIVRCAQAASIKIVE